MSENWMDFRHEPVVGLDQPVSDLMSEMTPNIPDSMMMASQAGGRPRTIVRPVCFRATDFARRRVGGRGAAHGVFGVCVT
ncbi:hypothetical protein, partial [Nocardia sp. NPDC058497]|uniref:hypothetical protein n=1 Tax=Nocardia sp. NPDC058497 TaxID=3346529 RepID=UPI0036652DC4